MIIKKYILVIFIFLTCLLSGCTQNEEEMEEYSGIIGVEKTMGYEYTITKEKHLVTWAIGYKGKIKIVEENSENQDQLRDYMTAVSDGKVVRSKLIRSFTYVFIVAIIACILYKKKRNIFKDAVIVIILASSIAIYIVMEASIDLNHALKVIKYHYLELIHSGMG